ncbi:hypothetical protein KSS87_015192 [Heliosperma pusillum]|nr:hypothetical protein KSS87_015192 [Heliosperma pusillum]
MVSLSDKRFSEVPLFIVKMDKYLLFVGLNERDNY